MPGRIQMTFHNGNELYNISQRRSTNKNNSSNSAVKLGMDLNTTMIGRIKNAPAGCGGCGK